MKSPWRRLRISTNRVGRGCWIFGWLGSALLLKLAQEIRKLVLIGLTGMKAGLPSPLPSPAQWEREQDRGTASDFAVFPPLPLAGEGWGED